MKIHTKVDFAQDCYNRKEFNAALFKQEMSWNYRRMLNGARSVLLGQRLIFCRNWRIGLYPFYWLHNEWISKEWFVHPWKKILQDSKTVKNIIRVTSQQCQEGICKYNIHTYTHAYLCTLVQPYRRKHAYIHAYTHTHENKALHTQKSEKYNRKLKYKEQQMLAI